MGVGFRRKPAENHFIQQGGVIISSGPEEIKDPENIDDREAQIVDFIGTALIVKDIYKPEYQFISDHHGNHSFRIAAPIDQSFEFMLSSAWSEGAVYNNKKAFSDYIRKTSMEYNSPVQSNFIQIQKKE